MIKINAIYAKQKLKPYQFQCQNYQQLKKNIQSKFSVDPNSIKFMKPPIKNQDSFEKYIKENKLQVTFNGVKKKVLEIQQIKIDKQLSKKEEDKQQKIYVKNFQQQQFKKQSNFQDQIKVIEKIEIKVQNQKDLNMSRKEKQSSQSPRKSQKTLSKQDQDQQLRKKLNKKYRVRREHQKRQIQERAILYWDQQQNDAQDIGTDHMTSTLILFRAIPEVKHFCYNYQLAARNPQGLFIQQMKLIMQQIDGNTGQPANPVQWAISFMVHCADLLQEDFPIFDFQYMVIKMIKVIDIAQKRADPNYKPDPKPLSQKEDPNQDKTLTQVRRWFGIYISQKTKEQDERERYNRQNFDSDMEEEHVIDQWLDYGKGDQILFFPFKKKQQRKQFLQYVFKCDVSTDSCKSIQKAIKNMFADIYENIGIIRLPKYVFIHLTTIGYPQFQEPDEWLDEYDEQKKRNRPKQTKKHYHKNLKIPLMLDVQQHCTKFQKDKNGQGKINRVNTFYPLLSYQTKDQDGQQLTYDLFKNYLQNKKGVNIKYYSKQELQYMFFQRQFLLDKDRGPDQLLHQFYFGSQNRDKPSGQFKLIGVIFHKGNYYHQPNEEHTKEQHGHSKKQCKGKLMTIVYKKNHIWLKFIQENVYEIQIEQVLDLILLKKIKPNEKLKTLWTPIKLLYKQICSPKSFTLAHNHL